MNVLFKSLYGEKTEKKRNKNGGVLLKKTGYYFFTFRFLWGDLFFRPLLYIYRWWHSRRSEG